MRIFAFWVKIKRPIRSILTQTCRLIRNIPNYACQLTQKLKEMWKKIKIFDFHIPSIKKIQNQMLRKITHKKYIRTNTMILLKKIYHENEYYCL